MSSLARLEVDRSELPAIQSNGPVMSAGTGMLLVLGIIVLQIILLATKQYIPSLVITGLTFLLTVTGMLAPTIQSYRNKPQFPPNMISYYPPGANLSYKRLTGPSPNFSVLGSPPTMPSPYSQQDPRELLPDPRELLGGPMVRTAPKVTVQQLLDAARRKRAMGRT